MNNACKNNNAGFSFVELIVAMLITSVVSLGVMAFVSLTSREYASTNSEVGIQTESSSAEDFLTKSIREATHYKVLNGTDYTALWVRGAVVGSEVDSSTGAMKDKYKYSLFVFDKTDNLLLYTTLKDFKNVYYTGDLLEEATLTGAGKLIPTMLSNDNKYLLAYHIDSFAVKDVTPTGTSDATHKYEDDNKILQLDIGYKYGSKSFSHSFEVKLRNDI